MSIAQLSRQFSKSVEHELTHIFAIMGDSYLPESAHTYISSVDQKDKGMDASGVLICQPQNSHATHNAAPKSAAH